jgi:cytidyltransferase-like protein
MIVVQAHGCFTVLHYGHLQHLKQARALGDRLIVTITAGRHIKQPVGRLFTDNQRREMLEEWPFIHEVRVIDGPGAEEAILAVKPNVYVKGAEYEGRLPEQELVERLGGRVVFTKGVTFSSTALARHL